MTSDVVLTDYLAVMRADLVAVVAGQDIAYHDTEPRGLGESPAAWFGRPSITWEPFDHEVLVDWPLTYAEHPVDPEVSTHEGDVTVWALVRALGAGPKVMVDGQRSVQFRSADPTTVTVGDVLYPAYAITIRTSVHIGFC